MTKTLHPINLYDEDTGKRAVLIEFKCKNRRFWRLGHYPVLTDTYTHLKDISDDPN